MPLPGEQSFRFEVTCRTGQGRGVRHEVVVAPDWSVGTGHDVEAERIAAAFGSSVTCLNVIDRLIPALRRGLMLRQRLVRPSIQRGKHGWIVTDPVERCRCRGAQTQSGLSLMTAAAAARHERSAQHLAKKFRVGANRLEALFEALEAQHSGLERIPDNPTARSLVLEPYGLVELWEAGIHPDRVIDTHRLLWPTTGAVPARFYLPFGTYLRADRWQPWSQFGLPVLDIEQLLDSGYQPGAVAALASRLQRTPRAVAGDLAAWLRVGCRPTKDEISHLFAHRGVRFQVPSSSAIDLVHEQIGSGDCTRTQVGLVLAVTRTTDHAVNALSAGVRTPLEAVTYMSTRGLL